jgi:hypothetical protein
MPKKKRSNELIQEAKSPTATKHYDELVAEVKKQLAPIKAMEDKLQADRLSNVKTGLQELHKSIYEDGENYMRLRGIYNHNYAFDLYKESIAKKFPPSNATIKEEYVSCGKD